MADELGNLCMNLDDQRYSYQITFSRNVYELGGNIFTQMYMSVFFFAYIALTRMAYKLKTVTVLNNETFEIERDLRAFGSREGGFSRLVSNRKGKIGKAEDFPLYRKTWTV